MSERRVTRRPRRGAPPGGGRERKTVDLTWDATETAIRAMAEIEKTGLELAPRPGVESPALPDDPTALDDSQLMTLFTQYAAWVDYSATVLGLAEIDDNMWKSLLEAKKDTLLLRLMPSSEALRKREDTMTRVKAEVDTHDEVVELQQQGHVAYARKKLANTVYERYDRDWFVLSREITRRSGGQEPKSRRASRWAP